MARSIWGGAISFGLVNVPVKLFTAVRKKDVRFHQLHRSDGARINQKRVCSADGEEVAYEDIVKGYEIAKGQYVLIDPEELEALDPESTHTIDIEDFVDLDQIDPLFFDSSYYVLPDDRGEKAYRLLLEAMRDSGKVGIARVVMRTKQYLVAIRPVENALVMSTMNFADEVVPESELEGLPGPSANVSDRELKMAQQLIESLSGDFDPSKYEDTYREKVLEMIEQKAEGKELVAQPETRAATPVVDLMAALEASLAAAKGEKAKDGAKAEGGKEQKAS
ncbi:MAG: non-homologous end joining protein Ku [Actinomycetota bacterium]